MKFRQFLLLLFASAFLILITLPAQAQSQAEINAAKAMAKQYGYSDKEIDAMMGKTGTQTGAAGSQGTAPINRNTPTSQQDSLMLLQQPYMPFTLVPKDTSNIFGHDIFRQSALTFIPSYNIPTPKQYVLGPGDEVIIDVWGASFTNITSTLSPEGSLVIPDYGPVYLIGQTVQQAEKALKVPLSQIYSGIAQEQPNTFYRLSLGQIRSVTVNVVGDVQRPGSYTLPALSNVCSALYMAEGVTPIGTVRDIKIYRHNKLYKQFDLYDYILNGHYDQNLRLEENDLIIVGPYVNVINIEGPVKRPMNYELKEGETLAALLQYSGGFKSDAALESIHIDRRKAPGGPESFNVMAAHFDSFALQNGDCVTVYLTKNEYKNRVSIAGPVWHQGNYALSEQLSDVKSLIEQAGGLREDAYLGQGTVNRLDENRLPAAVSFSLVDVMAGTTRVPLQRDDQVQLYSTNDLRDNTSIQVFGEVNAPGGFAYRSHMTLGDAIMLAKGYTTAATQTNIAVARRVKNPDTGKVSDTTATLFTYNLLENPAATMTPLEPYDMVFVRALPDYKPQQTITIEGEVVYPGMYVIAKNTVRLSDVIHQCGNVTPDAYIKGASLKRTIDKDEAQKVLTTRKMDKRNLFSGDTLTIISDSLARVQDSLALIDIQKETYSVGIDLEAALRNPGSAADMVLRTNDIIMIPKMLGTVKVSGGVLYENTVAYNPAFSWQDYIAQAGGFLKEARKNKTYIVFMNSTVAARGKGNFKVEPGCEIVVPQKVVSQEDKRSAATTAISMLTGITSLATMVVYLLSSLK